MYLGLPLSALFKSLSTWDVVKERFHKRLALWKRQILVRNGRLTLFESTICSMLIYLMSLLVIPKMVSLDS